jgi:hypothetical protein
MVDVARREANIRVQHVTTLLATLKHHEFCRHPDHYTDGITLHHVTTVQATFKHWEFYSWINLGRSFPINGSGGCAPSNGTYWPEQDYHQRCDPTENALVRLPSGDMLSTVRVFSLNFELEDAILDCTPVHLKLYHASDQ